MQLWKVAPFLQIFQVSRSECELLVTLKPFQIIFCFGFILLLSWGYAYTSRSMYVKDWVIEETVLKWNNINVFVLGYCTRVVTRHHLIECPAWCGFVSVQGGWELWELLIPHKFYLQWILWLCNLQSTPFPPSPDRVCDCLNFVTSYLLELGSVWIPLFNLGFFEPENLESQSEQMSYLIPPVRCSDPKMD